MRGLSNTDPDQVMTSLRAPEHKGFGFFDANNMPILCQIVRPEYRATGYGIMNLVSIASGAGITIVPVPQRLVIFPSIFPTLGSPLLSRNLSCHDRLMNFLVTEKFEQPVELAHSHPLDYIDMLRERAICFVGKCSSNNFLYTGFSRRISKQSRVNTVAGNNSQNVWRGHAGNLAE